MAVCGAPQRPRQHLLPPGMREHAAVLEDEQRLDAPRLLAAALLRERRLGL